MGAPKLKPNTEDLETEILELGRSKSAKVDTNKFLQTIKRVKELETQAEKTVEVMDKKVYQLECIMEFSRLLNSSLNPREVREKALKATCRLLECETATLYMVDSKTNELFFETTLGTGQLIKEIRLPIDETSLAGSVALTGRSLQINDVAKDPRHFKKADKRAKFETRNMVVCPVINKGKVIGVLQAINKVDHGFITEDLQLLETLSNQVAIAIENAQLYEKQRRNFFQTAEALAEAIEVRDLYTGGHSKRVKDFSFAIGSRMGGDREMLEDVKLAAVLHDIGKIGIDDCVLRKQGKLNQQEFEVMKKHPEMGYEILKHIEDLRAVTLGMRHHHEKFDGSGYPMGLKGEEIPLISRIIAVADTFDAITSTRPYRKGHTGDFAIDEIREWSGRQFDPKVVKAFLICYEEGEIIPHSVYEAEEEFEKQKKLEEEIKKASKKPGPEEYER